MSHSELIERYELGKKSFLKLFNMPKKELLETLKEICGDRVSKETLEESSNVYKKLTNDEPTELSIASWDSLIISPFGITYQKEHGTAERIVEFNKFFKI